MGSKKTEKTFDTDSAEDKSQEGNTKEGKRERFLLNGADNATKDACHKHERKVNRFCGQNIGRVRRIESVSEIVYC